MEPQQQPQAQPEAAEREKVIWEDIEDVSIEEEEFDSLFSREVVRPKKKEEKKVAKPKVDKPATIIDSKRSQNIGILLKSTHIDIARLEDVVYTFESSLDSEVLQQVQEVQATKEELEQLKAHTEASPDKPLDTPDQFLLDLSGLSFFNERITCIMFQTKFSDSISEIENRLNNIRSCCDFLTTSQSMKNTMAVLLSCGNYMNGGNRQRGQADGFVIDILPKIKDVKSKDSSLNLLVYIVRLCIQRFEAKAGSSEAVLPVPEPSDLEKCQHIDFETQRGECAKVKKELDKARNNTEKIFDKSPEDLKEPFNSKMKLFLESADSQLKELGDLLEDCVKKFKYCMYFYKFTPKVGKVEDAKPEDFFSLWYPFCDDYKKIWKKEQVKIQKELLKEERQKHKTKKDSLKNVEIKKTPVGGLKAKISRRKTGTGSGALAPVPGSPRLERSSAETVTVATPPPEQQPQQAQETPKTTGLKAKLQQRKKKQAAAALANQNNEDQSGAEN